MGHSHINACACKCAHTQIRAHAHSQARTHARKHYSTPTPAHELTRECVFALSDGNVIISGAGQITEPALYVCLFVLAASGVAQVDLCCASAFQPSL
eukprot:6200252-Pleurochrysis_carterae.AAC.1